MERSLLHSLSVLYPSTATSPRGDVSAKRNHVCVHETSEPTVPRNSVCVRTWSEGRCVYLWVTAYNNVTGQCPRCFLPLWASRYCTLVEARSRGQVLLGCLAELLLSWQRRCRGSRSASPSKNRTSTKHYASTRAASLLLMDINIYAVWKIFSQWSRVGGLWRAHTWADEVVCLRHLWLCAHVWKHKCISQHPLNLTHRNNNVRFQFNIQMGFLLWLIYI